MGKKISVDLIVRICIAVMGALALLTLIMPLVKLTSDAGDGGFTEKIVKFLIYGANSSEAAPSSANVKGWDVLAGITEKYQTEQSEFVNNYTKLSIFAIIAYLTTVAGAIVAGVADKKDKKLHIISAILLFVGALFMIFTVVFYYKTINVNADVFGKFYYEETDGVKAMNEALNNLKKYVGISYGSIIFMIAAFLGCAGSVYRFINKK